ncbi:MAG: hypothetical protein COA78_34910 [Blastopirellula sp.]|nr:MAG: hypothetical protein COA78_34910 [Blastopirellula sp.]
MRTATNKQRGFDQRSGSILVLIAVLLPVLLGLAAFAIDIGYISLTRSRLQGAADSAALAAAEELPNGEAALAKAKLIGGFNLNNTDGIVANEDVEFGTWNEDSEFFTTSAVADADAVRVTARRSSANNNSLSLFLGVFSGMSETDVSATSIALISKRAGIGTRFLIDDEMIDKDITSIENLANAIGRDAEELVTARGFNDGKNYGDSDWSWEDNFLDIPAGAQLTLPTGQGTDYDNNDAGLFDIDNPDFPFTSAEDFRDFVMYSESGGDSSKWGTDKSSILNQLDPLRGVAPITDDSIYSTFVDPDFVHISPIFESDVSTLDMNGSTPQVNAKGQRRGLLAFKIIAVGNNPGGSDLPYLILEIVDPSTTTINDLSPTSGSGSATGNSARTVQ